jgi:hypothetical protein
MVKKLFVCLILCCSVSKTMEDNPVVKRYAFNEQIMPLLVGIVAYTYHKEAITPESILRLAPKLREEDEIAIQQWLVVHQKMVSDMLTFPFQAKIEEREQYLANLKTLWIAAQLQNISRSNFIFVVTLGNGNKYAVKIAGPANRRENYNSFLQKPYGSQISPEDYKIIETMPTYQTISRVAHGLRLKEWVEQNPDSKVKDATSYIVHVPWQPLEVNDANYVTVEEWIDSKGTPENFPQLFLDNVWDVARSIGHAGLWNIFADQFVIDEEENIYHIDKEQPSNSNLKDFFHKNRTKYEGNVACGLSELLMMCKELESSLSAKGEKEQDNSL